MSVCLLYVLRPGGSVVSTGSAVMLSRSREHVVDSGSRVFIDCEFHMHNLSMFDNPIVWEKQQLGESTVLNIMGVVQEPFATTRRYDIVLLAQPPRYRLRLKIKGDKSEVVSRKESNPLQILPCRKIV